MKKVVHFEVHFVILYSKTELLSKRDSLTFFICHANHIGKKQDLTSDQICSQHFEWYLNV